MIRRRDIWFLGLLIVVIAFQLWLLGFERRLVTENYPLLRIGMSQDEVEGLLGGPPGNYGQYFYLSSTLTGFGSVGIGEPIPVGAVQQIWCDDSNRFEIYFDAEGRVVRCCKRNYRQEGLFDWLCTAPKDLSDPFRNIAAACLLGIFVLLGLKALVVWLKNMDNRGADCFRRGDSLPAGFCEQADQERQNSEPVTAPCDRDRGR